MNASIQDLIESAARARAAGNIEAAERLARQALGIRPESVQATILLALIEAESGRLEAAARTFGEVCRLDPFSFQARMSLSRIYLSLQRPQDAAEQALQAAKLQPADPWCHIQLGTCLMHARRKTESIEALRKAVGLAPDLGPAHDALAIAYQTFGDTEAAINELKTLFELEPGILPIGLRLGGALLDAQRVKEAESIGRKVVERFPNSSEAHSLLARTLIAAFKSNEALPHAEAATALAPNQAIHYATQATILQNIGRIAEAGAMLEQAISVEPTQAYLYSSLAFNRKITEADGRLVKAMENLETLHSKSPQDLVHIEYALGKARQDLGQFEAAMRHFDHANDLARRLRFGDKPFDRKAHEASVDFMVNTFTSAFLRKHGSCGVDSNKPIFVVGMMRSGTTLVEQVLSSHSKVGGGGERSFWLDHRSEVGSRSGFDEFAVNRLAARYVEELTTLVPAADFVVDKMPVNYSLLGLIHLALPNAKIIHISRHPVDTCLSIYTTPNRSRLEWAHHKPDLVFVYRQYERLMRHWNGILSKTSMLTIRYEDLVEDRETVTRRMLDFCDLGWEEACLYPERNERSVFTPSVWQVRQPVYSSSVGRWKDYEPHLGEFARLL